MHFQPYNDGQAIIIQYLKGAKDKTVERKGK